MPHQVRQQHVHHIFVNRYMVHITIVVIRVAACLGQSQQSTIDCMIRGVKLACIPVTDQERALAFYTEKLGFRLLTDQPFTAEQRWIELGIPGAETRVVLFRFDNGIQPGGFMNLTYWCDDVEKTAAQLKSAGVTFTKDPEKAPWGTFAIFQDVDGNTFVLSSR